MSEAVAIIEKEYNQLWKVEPTDKRACWKVHGERLFPFFIIFGHTFLVIQVVALYTTKNSSGISLIAFIVYALSSLAWLFYSFVLLPKRNNTIIASSTVAFILAIIIIVGIIMYK